MPIEWSKESFHEKELTKWDRPKRQGGMNRDGFERFPQMLYKAQLQPLSGKYEVAMQRDVISADKTVVILDAEQFNASCQLIVNSDREYERARADGWRDSQAEAMQFHEKLQDDVAQAAAFRASEDGRMTAKAQAEAKAAEEATDKHVAEVPRKPTDPALTQRRREAMAKAREAKAAKRQAQGA